MESAGACGHAGVDGGGALRDYVGPPGLPSRCRGAPAGGCQVAAPAWLSWVCQLFLASMHWSLAVAHSLCMSPEGGGGGGGGASCHASGEALKWLRMSVEAVKWLRRHGCAGYVSPFHSCTGPLLLLTPFGCLAEDKRPREGRGGKLLRRHGCPGYVNPSLRSCNGAFLSFTECVYLCKG